MTIATGTRLISTTRNATYTLASSVGEGGEGRVYGVVERPGFVAKISKRAPDATATAKLETLIKARTPDLACFSAWPEERLIKDNATVGFLMPVVLNATPLHEFLSPASRFKVMPSASYAFLVAVAINLAKAIAAFHNQGFVVGDLNTRNILVRPDGTVHFIDIDSIQVGDGALYNCPVGVTDYTAPELQGQNYAKLRRTKSSDAFAYAIIAYQLFAAGRHPFDTDPDLDRSQCIKLFQHGLDINIKITSPLALLGICETQILTNDVIKLMRTCFSKPLNGKSRPPVDKFVGALKAMQATLVPCRNNPRHQHPMHEQECPWCASEKSGRPELFGKTVFGTKPAPKAIVKPVIATAAPIKPATITTPVLPTLPALGSSVPHPAPAWKVWPQRAFKGIWDFTIQVFFPTLWGLVANWIFPSITRFGLWLLPRKVWRRIGITMVVITTLYIALYIATFGVPNPFRGSAELRQPGAIEPATASTNSGNVETTNTTTSRSTP